MEIDISEECKIYSLEDKLCDFKNLYQQALKQLNENSKGILLRVFIKFIMKK